MEDERDLQARRWQRSSEAMVDLVRRYGVRDARILQAEIIPVRSGMARRSHNHLSLHI
jgi:hypothetical protein